jgi:T4-like virus Myoviridae tail sheath stabiliser
MQFFYDEQIRRYLTQFMRILGGFSVKTGKDRDGNESYIQVPVRYGDINRTAAHIMKNQSENMINTVPFISCYVTDLQISAERRLNPTHVDKVRVYEKKFDAAAGEYVEGEVGNTYTIERYMPVPYDLTVQVDIWTSNTEQKLQILEQMLVLFNPSINLKLNDNPFDWSNLTYTELVNVVWSVRQVPMGTDDIIDVAALNFTLPILINPPAKVKRQTLIHTILTEIKKLSDNETLDWVPGDPIPNKQWVLVTFENLKLQVRIEGDQATLLNKNGGTTDDAGNLLTWEAMLKPYGELKLGISNLRLRRGLDPSDASQDIIATIVSIDPETPNIATIDIDSNSLPDSTVAAINAVIDPAKVAPSAGLPNAVLGQRYLVINDVPNSTYWGILNAQANDIIEYNGSSWIVSFDSSSNSNAVVLNTTSNLLYEWRNSQWISAVEGTYQNGWWRIYL